MTRKKRATEIESDLVTSLREEISPARLRLALAVLAVLVIYGVLESLLWRDQLWGAHFWGFYSPWYQLAALVVFVILSPLGNRIISQTEMNPESLSPSASRWLPGLAGAGAGLVFWLLRERHLFWGDSLPLSILIPQGQTFHPDEPLSIYVHHLLFVLGQGNWSGATAVAIGSVVSGALFVGWSVHWFSRRAPDTSTAILAAAALATQGYGQIFFGHVENYSYLSLFLLFFFTKGVDFLEGRSSLVWPLAAALAAFAFHILGGVALALSTVLVGFGLLKKGRRASTIAISLGALVFLFVAEHWSAPLYAPDRAFDRFTAAVTAVLVKPADPTPYGLLTFRHLLDVWSQFQIVGPLSLLVLVVFLTILPGRSFLRTWKGVFLFLGAVIYVAPSLFTGAGNLGAARNWDLFAAPSIIPALCGLVLILDHVERRQATRILLGLVAVSLFHTVPWVALNTQLERTVARVQVLPLEKGRSQMMLGTHFLNAGSLPEAEAWFRKAIEEYPDNVNSQSGLGLSLARQGKLDEAVEPLSYAVRLKPTVIQYRVDLVTLYLQVERWQDAVRGLREILAIQPKHRPSWDKLADGLIELSSPDSAASVLEQSLAHFPTDRSLKDKLASSYELWIVKLGRAGRFEEARGVLERFASRFPNDPRVQRFRLALANRAGDGSK